MQLTGLKQKNPNEIELSWSDGKKSLLPLALVRDACPCAGCKGETVLFKQYAPPPPDRQTAGRYQLKDATTIGNYALKLSWGDGHDTGIYSWDHLRSLEDFDTKSERGSQ